MKFESNKLDLILELKSDNGEVQTYHPSLPCSAKTFDKIMNEWTLFEKAQESLPKDERYPPALIIIKELKMLYNDIDEEWMYNNMRLFELQNIVNYVAEQLTGIKKK